MAINQFCQFRIVTGFCVVLYKKSRGWVYYIFAMLFRRSAILALIIAYLISQAVSKLINTNHPSPVRYQADKKDIVQMNELMRRLLQVVASDPLQPDYSGEIASSVNQIRIGLEVPSIKTNTAFTQIIDQWANGSKYSISLVNYIQLYGILGFQTYTFTTIPGEYIVRVVLSQCEKCVDPEYTELATYITPVGVNRYYVIVILKGGLNAAQKNYTINQVNAIVDNLRQLNYSVNSTGNVKKIDNVNNQSIGINQTAVPVTTTTIVIPTTIPPDLIGTPPTLIVIPITEIITANLTTLNETPAVNSSINSPITPLIPATPLSTSSVITATIPTYLTSLPVTPPASIPIPNTIPPSAPTTQIAISPATPQAPNVTASPVSPSSNITIPPTVKHLASSSLLSNISSSQNTSSSLPLITQPTFQKTYGFQNLVLNHSIPSHFMKNEIFNFKGDLTIPNPSGIMMNVIFTGISSSNKLNFAKYLPPNQTHFSIATKLSLSGTYYLSVFPGSSGITNRTNYTIDPSFIGRIVSRAPNPIQQASLVLKGNDLWVEWTYDDVAQPCLTQLVFSQGNSNKVTFLLSNYEANFQVPYNQFSNFNSGTVNLQISQAFSQSESAISRTSVFSAPYTIIFTAVQHNYAIYNNMSGITQPPVKIPLGGTISISGIANISLQNQIVLLTPSNIFKSYYLIGNTSINTVPANTAISVPITLHTAGVYILEVNDAEGSAVINAPVYVGDIYPLLPDFSDLSPVASGHYDFNELNEPQMIDDRRYLVLNLINGVRKLFGVNAVYQDSQLNDLAQSYSMLQMRNDFFGHYDLQGKSPNDRAKALGILQAVGENLALNANLTQSQLMLQRSPAHLRNMVNPIWTRIGLGINKNSNNIYYVVQQFSSRDLQKYPLNSTDISDIKYQIVSLFSSKYTQIKTENTQLSQYLSSYQQMTNRPNLVTYLNSKNIYNLMVTNIMVTYNAGNFIDLVKSQATVNMPPTFSQIGVAIAYTQGYLQIFAAFI